MCDLAEGASCTRVFSSEYGKGLGLLLLLTRFQLMMIVVELPLLPPLNYATMAGLIGRMFGEASVFNQPNPVYGVPVYFWFILSSFS